MVPDFSGAGAAVGVGIVEYGASPGASAHNHQRYRIQGGRNGGGGYGADFVADVPVGGGRCGGCGQSGGDDRTARGVYGTIGPERGGDSDGNTLCCGFSVGRRNGTN